MIPDPAVHLLVLDLRPGHGSLLVSLFLPVATVTNQSRQADKGQAIGHLTPGHVQAAASLVKGDRTVVPSHGNHLEARSHEH